jgi:hypothetical protein
VELEGNGITAHFLAVVFIVRTQLAIFQKKNTKAVVEIKDKVIGKRSSRAILQQKIVDGVIWRLDYIAMCLLFVDVMTVA